MLVMDNEGKLFDDRRSKDRRKNDVGHDPERRKEDRRKSNLNETKKKK